MAIVVGCVSGQLQTTSPTAAYKTSALASAPISAYKTSAPTSPPTAADKTFDPTSAYQIELIQGFTVLINPEVLNHREEARQMRNELDEQLTAIVRVMPAQPLVALQQVRIWVEWEARRNGAAEFHPSAVWLQENGYNPEKAGSVELSNAANFVQWSRTGQPWMVLHELAHAYHYLVLGQQHEGIETAYQQALDRRLYESVAYINGSQQTAYSMTNVYEYYAELSEAYFGKNDFYPFTHNELAQHDPVGFRLMEATWGQL
jgi:hypothetical protein